MELLRPVRKYLVTCTPAVRSFAGTWSSGEHTVEVYARSRAEAKKYANSAYRAEEGREAPRQTYRAALAEDQ